MKKSMLFVAALAVVCLVVTSCQESVEELSLRHKWVAVSDNSGKYDYGENAWEFLVGDKCKVNGRLDGGNVVGKEFSYNVQLSNGQKWLTVSNIDYEFSKDSAQLSQEKLGKTNLSEKIYEDVVYYVIEAHTKDSLCLREMENYKHGVKQPLQNGTIQFVRFKK